MIKPPKSAPGGEGNTEKDFFFLNFVPANFKSN